MTAAGAVVSTVRIPHLAADEDLTLTDAVRADSAAAPVINGVVVVYVDAESSRGGAVERGFQVDLGVHTAPFIPTPVCTEP